MDRYGYELRERASYIYPNEISYLRHFRRSPSNYQWMFGMIRFRFAVVFVWKRQWCVWSICVCRLNWFDGERDKASAKWETTIQLNAKNGRLKHFLQGSVCYIRNSDAIFKCFPKIIKIHKSKFLHKREQPMPYATTHTHRQMKLK